MKVMENVIEYTSIEFYDNNRMVYVYTNENKMTHMKCHVDKIEKDGTIISGWFLLKPKKE